MILFKPEHVDLILSGRKTQTRRLGKPRWKVGAVHQAATRLFDPAAVFARLRICEVREERLFTISDEDVVAEGYDHRIAFLAAFERINGGPIGGDVWVVRFELVGGGAVR